MIFDKDPIYEFRGPWGVPIQIGPSILLLAFLFIDFGGGAKSLAYDLMFLAIVVTSIFLHELGHAWGCMIQNVPVRRIMIHGGGGFCERTRSATRAEQELIVAMGPIVNLVLWAVFGLMEPFVADPEIAWVLSSISFVNGFLAVLNLMPVHPLDGGKLFELLLRRLLPPLVAGRVSGAVGLALALLWIPAMVWSFLFLGLFLFFIPSIPLHWRMMRGVQAA